MWGWGIFVEENVIKSVSFDPLSYEDEYGLGTEDARRAAKAARDKAWRDMKSEANEELNAAYIVHACNAYPELVAALNECRKALNADYDAEADAGQKAAALLAKLREGDK